MKNFYFVLLLTGFLIGKSQTATNFNVNDCNNINHDLFTELNSGKVIVLCWVMPCGTCIGPSLSAYTEVQNLQSTYPNKIYFYLIDDYGNTTCSTLSSWATTYGMPAAITFSNPLVSTLPVINMNDYGGPGMPKIVVLGGASHTVFDNQNNAPLNVPQFTNALNQAIVASSIGINEISGAKNAFSVYPNPSNNSRLNFTYNLEQSGNVSIEIFNVLGSKVKEIVNENQNSGKHEFSVETGLKNGSYIVKFTSGNLNRTYKMVIND